MPAFLILEHFRYHQSNQIWAIVTTIGRLHIDTGFPPFIHLLPSQRRRTSQGWAPLGNPHFI